MNEDELEKLRKKSLIKFWLLIIIATLVVLFAFFILFETEFYSNSLNKQLVNFLVIIISMVLVISAIIYVQAYWITKKFENTVKKYLIKKALTSFNNAEIHWETNLQDGTYYTDDNSTSTLSLSDIEIHKKANEIYKNEIGKLYGFMYKKCHSWGVKDDRFWGIYSNTPFAFIEVHDDRFKRYGTPFFNGTVLKIGLKNTYNNKILFLKKAIFYESWYSTLKNGLTKLKIKNIFNKNYEIYALNINNIDFITNNNFVDFVNTIQKYSFFLEDNSLFVVITHWKDKFKYGSLFKRIDDEKQYKNFYNDVNVILNIIELVEKYQF